MSEGEKGECPPNEFFSRYPKHYRKTVCTILIALYEL